MKTHTKLFAGRLDERRVRYLLAAFFLALAVPAAVLVAQAYSRLEWDAFRGSQLLAQDLVERIDADLRAAIFAEEARSFGDYAFLVVEGDVAANFVQRSPLSAFPVASALPGVIGYFQVDASGNLSTPLLPQSEIDTAAYGISSEEANARRALEQTIRDVLAENRLVERAAPAALNFATAPAEELLRQQSVERDAADAGPAAPPAAVPCVDCLGEETQAAFDRLARNAPPPSGARALAEDSRTAEESREAKAGNALDEIPVSGSRLDETERQKRTEQALVPERQAAPPAQSAVGGAADAEFRIRTFESELDPFELGLLDTGHMVLFRSAWRDGQRYIQGVLIDRGQLLERSIETAFRSSTVSTMSMLTVLYRGETLGASSAGGAQYLRDDLSGTLLQRARLSPPFGDVELAFRVTALPRTPGSALLLWLSVTITALLAGGFFFMYRFAVSQIRLTRQQQDFVSAVSHELKTPLTSIRMYGEMLKAGWADDAKKQTYYDYIHAESERLSRLIDNVLQLARLTRSAQHFDMKRVGVAELLDTARSKVATHVERAGFALEIRNYTPAGTDIVIDADCFAQIVINLVDNALKFSVGAERKVVEIATRRESDGRVLFTVRDYGPGISKSQMKKIFELFYRPANELTRETVGTGIGLALVRELCTAMGGRVEVRNCEPGAEFRLSFPP